MNQKENAAPLPKSPRAVATSPDVNNRFTDNTTPFSTDAAEQALLRAALALPATDAAELLELATAEDFNTPHHRAIFSELSTLVRDRAVGNDHDKPLDPCVLLTAIQAAGHFAIGWPISRSLVEIVTGNPASLTDARVLAADLRNGRLRRAMATLAEQLHLAAIADDFDAAALAMNQTEDLFNVAGRAPALASAAA